MLKNRLLPVAALGVVTILQTPGCGGDPDTGNPPVDDPPYVTASTPAEGATDVPTTLDVITLTFNEPMNTLKGSVTLEGGGHVGARTWDGMTLKVAVSGLEYDTDYRLVLTGFEDAAGKPLDGEPWLHDGALDFRTVVDTTRPKVVSSDPNEGQAAVHIGISVIRVTFDEPMDTSISSARLDSSAGEEVLSGLWDTAGTTVNFTLTEPLAYSTNYRLDLSGFRDRAGNLLDPGSYLLDGALNFTTVANPDMTPPHVVSSTPAEGAAGVDPELVIILQFNESMDASLTEVMLIEDGMAPRAVTGVWSDQNTVFTVIPDPLPTPGATVHLDVRNLVDLANNFLDASHAYLGDGILDFTLGVPTGEGCADPLVISQALHDPNGAYIWEVPAGGVVSAEGQFLCDGSSPGASKDVVVRYTKKSDTLANGGMLLHVSAVGGSDDINLEIVSGTCDAYAGGTVESCLWVKRSWDKFLDVPAGTYWIWVADNNTTGDFPGATILVEEIPASAPQAEGEGCFAPYTTSSAIYTPPATGSDPHVWTIPSTINGFEIAPSSSSVGSISCDNHATYGDIHGPDAVIEFQKASASSILLIDVVNLDPTLSQSDLNVEVLTECDSRAPTTQSLFCAADKDNHSFTANAPAGPVYVWVATEATTEAFNGAEVRIREFTPGPGETRFTPEPLVMSGAITPTSTVGLDRPSCFPTTGNVHWYSYTTTATLFGVKTDAPGAIALFDASGEKACVPDASQVALGVKTTPGSSVVIAVESPTPVTYLTLIDQTWTGIAGTTSDLGISFPVSAATEYSMAVGTNEIYMGSTSEIWSFPKAGMGTAVEHNTAEGLGTAQLGYDIAWGAGRLFSIDSTTSTTASRLFSVFDELSGAWAPVAWDDPSGYPASAPVYAMAFDGSALILGSRETVAAEGVTFMSVDTTNAPATPQVLGTNNSIYYVTGLAADASWIYVVARDLSAVEGLYRIDRANIAAPAVRLAVVDQNTTRTAVVVDDLTAAQIVYVRDDANVVHAVVDPGSASPIHVGGLLNNGGAADYAMAIDHATHTLYLFDSTLAPNGGILKVQ